MLPSSETGLEREAMSHSNWYPFITSEVLYQLSYVGGVAVL